jgi:DNA polymerase (family 10)
VDAYIEAVREAEKQVGIKALAGVEVDIRQDGTLDLPDSDLAKFDLVISSIHRAHEQNVQERLLAAIQNPRTHIIGHPTGRQFGHRGIPDIDWHAVFAACHERGVALEINNQPDRVDLPEMLVRQARSHHCFFTAGSDAHCIDDVGLFEYTSAVARKAELTREEICLNLRNLRALQNLH